MQTDANNRRARPRPAHRPPDPDGPFRRTVVGLNAEADAALADAVERTGWSASRIVREALIRFGARVGRTRTGTGRGGTERADT